MLLVKTLCISCAIYAEPMFSAMIFNSLHHDVASVTANTTRVYLLDFFCSGIQFNLLLSPYPCFISLLYLDLYVLGDDALIS